MAALRTHNKKVYVDQPATCVLEPLTLHTTCQFRRTT